MFKSLILAAAVLSACGKAAGKTLTWGVDGGGGSGTWTDNSSTLNWFDGSNNVGWPDFPNFSSAVFAGTGGAVSVYGAPIVDEITFQSAGYVLNNFFLKASPNGLNIIANADVTINSSVFGDNYTPNGGVLTKQGAGTLTLSSFAYLTAINIDEGQIYAPNTVGVEPVYNFASGSNATLIFNGGQVGGLNGGSATSGVFLASSTAGAQTLTIGPQGGSYAGILSDNGANVLSLTKSGLGTQVLTAANTYTGSTAVGAGTLSFSGGGSALNSQFVVQSGGILLLDDSSGSIPNRISGTAPFTLSGALVLKSGNAAPASETIGPLNLPAGTATITLQVDPAQSATLTFASLAARSPTNYGLLEVFGVNPGAAPGSGNIVFSTAPSMVNGLVPGVLGAGSQPATATFVTYGANGLSPIPDGSYASTFAGGASTLVNVAGANALTASAAISALRLQPGSSVTGSTTLQIASGSVLALPGSEQITSGGIDFGPVEGILITQGDLTVNAPITGSSAASGISKYGRGTLTLNAAGSYTGLTTIAEGTLRLGNGAAFGNSSGVTVTGGAILDLAGGVAVGNLPLSLYVDPMTGLGGLRSAESTASWAGGVTGYGGAIDVEAGPLTLSGAFNAEIYKTGPGALFLTGPNTSGISQLNINAGSITSTVSSDYLSTSYRSGPFGSALRLAGGTTILAPSGTGKSVTLSTGGNAGRSPTFTGGINYTGSGSLELDRGANASLTFRTGSIQGGNYGTLIIATSTGTLGAGENILVTNGVPVANGIVSASIIQQSSDASRSGSFLTYGSSGLAPASYSGATDLNTADNTTVFLATAPQTLTAPASVYALADNAQTINLGSNALTLGSSAATAAGVILNGGSITNGTLANSYTSSNNGAEMLVYTSAAGGAISTQISVSSGFAKFGPGTLVVSGNVVDPFGGLSPVIAANGGTLDFRGTTPGSIYVAVDSVLAGFGTVGRYVGGGLISPGEHAPGILTAGETGPGNFAFEYTQLGMPNFLAPAASGNTLLRLTEGGAPFSTALTRASVINIYFDRPGGLNKGDVFDGGFEVDQGTDFLSSIQNASFRFYVSDPNGTVTWDGANYHPYNGPISISTVPETADFGAGPTPGFILQLAVPEPAAWHLLAIGAVFRWRIGRRSRKR